MDIAVVQHWEYFLFVFIASVGVLQLAASYSQLQGLLFFQNKILSYLFALLAIGGSFEWFFGYNNRIDTVMRRVGLEGAQQFLYFNMAAFLALVLTLIISSVLHAYRHRAQREQKEYPEGLGALRETSYFESLKHSLRSIFQEKTR
jgi:hypothetical protein